ncbi:MAG: LysE family transporter [Sulfurimonas sp.]|nr:LysE family transporter [Sulfurimonas sp.]
MNIDLLTILLVTLLPIIASPGPANILYAASASSFGIKKTIPFWLSTNITSLFQTLAIGLGLNLIMQIYPLIIVVLKYIGVLFLLYLAYKFSKLSVNAEKKIEVLTFRDGVIIEILNMKFLLIPSLMFSQFYTPSDGYVKIFILSFTLLLITLTTSMIWMLGGNSLASFVSDGKMQKYQGVFFSLLLFITAIWLGFN